MGNLTHVCVVRSLRGTVVAWSLLRGTVVAWYGCCVRLLRVTVVACDGCRGSRRSLDNVGKKTTGAWPEQQRDKQGRWWEEWERAERGCCSGRRGSTAAAERSVQRTVVGKCKADAGVWSAAGSS